MKQMPKSDFIEILKRVDSKDIDVDTCKNILDSYGDEWYIDCGVWTLTVENKNRKKLLK